MFQAGRASRLSPSSFPLERFDPFKNRDRRDASTSLRLQLREQDHVADAFLAEEHHAEAVDANADAAGRGHAVFEGDQSSSRSWLVQWFQWAGANRGFNPIFECAPKFIELVLCP